MKAAPGLHAALEEVLRNDRGRLIAALVARLGDFQLAEDCLQEASEAAMTHWARSGVPARPIGWLLRVAQRRALDRLRRAANFARKSAEIALLQAEDEVLSDVPDIPDKRLELIFTCCHPALDAKSRVALTLRTLGGLTTGEIARAFLDKEATMGQRLSRAKAKIAATAIPFRVPGPEEWPTRLSSVLTVIYLIFNEGYSRDAGAGKVAVELCAEAIWLARMVHGLRPDTAEVLGLLSLMLTTDARRAARLGDDGRMVALQAQDRTRWNAQAMAEGLDALDKALCLLDPGPYQIKAAMSALHIQAKDHADTDWHQMLLLYDALLGYEPTPVVRLNRCVVLAELAGAAAALAEMRALATELAQYQPYFATLAALLAKDGQHGAAVVAYEQAIKLSGTDKERQFLQNARNKLAQ